MSRFKVGMLVAGISTRSDYIFWIQPVKDIRNGRLIVEGIEPSFDLASPSNSGMRVVPATATIRKRLLEREEHKDLKDWWTHYSIYNIRAYSLSLSQLRRLKKAVLNIVEGKING